MHVVLGATSDIGRRAVAALAAQGFAVRATGRAAVGGGLPAGVAWARADLTRPRDLAVALDGARTVVCCAHARFAPGLLAALPDTVGRVILTGSTWRWSTVPEARADQVRAAEAAFLAHGRPGAMLHPTMIYGGTQEVNLRRLIAVIRRTPVLPLPDGGRKLVQPIHVADVAAALVAAATRDWATPEVIPVPGPRPFPWAEMARRVAAALGRPLAILPVPLGLPLAALEALRGLGLRPPLDPNVLRRFREDVVLPVEPLRERLGIDPRPFETGVVEALREWGEI